MVVHTAPLTPEVVRERVLAHRAEIEAYGVSRFGICGSIARREAHPDSDLDVVVEMDLSLSTQPFRRFFELIAFLEELFHCKIDLLTRDKIKPFALESIERDLIPIF